MLYHYYMATQGHEEKAAVNPKLRRKMLERWENEGGKVADIDSSPASAGEPHLESSRRRTPKARPRKSK
jgi:hypothetical protein